jgi:hypothetical protein
LCTKEKAILLSKRQQILDFYGPIKEKEKQFIGGQVER